MSDPLAEKYGDRPVRNPDRSYGPSWGDVDEALGRLARLTGYHVGFTLYSRQAQRSAKRGTQWVLFMVSPIQEKKPWVPPRFELNWPNPQYRTVPAGLLHLIEQAEDAYHARGSGAQLPLGLQGV